MIVVHLMLVFSATVSLATFFYICVVLFKIFRPNHSENIFYSMGTIMTVILEESEDISPELLSCLLDSVKNDNKADDSKLSKKTETSQKRKSELSGHGNQMKNKRAANRDCSAILGLKAGRLDDTSGPKIMIARQRSIRGKQKMISVLMLLQSKYWFYNLSTTHF
ncbi:hypothetical protein B296_00023204, partial [Ensete ventricosum]